MVKIKSEVKYKYTSFTVKQDLYATQETHPRVMAIENSRYLRLYTLKAPLT